MVLDGRDRGGELQRIWFLTFGLQGLIGAAGQEVEWS